MPAPFAIISLRAGRARETPTACEIPPVYVETLIGVTCSETSYRPAGATDILHVPLRAARLLLPARGGGAPHSGRRAVRGSADDPVGDARFFMERGLDNWTI